MPNVKSGDWISGAPTLGMIAVALIGVIAAGFNVFMARPPMRSPRPTTDTTWHATPSGKQTVASRLWQDPLAAAVEARKSPAQPRNCFDTVLRSMGLSTEPPYSGTSALTPLANGQEYLLLTVLVSSEPYAEVEEKRLRTRYAVLSALGAAGYVPLDRQHLGVYHTWGRKDLPPSLLIPFESYEPSPTTTPAHSPATQSSPTHGMPRPQYGLIHVLWVDEDELEKERTVAFLASLRHALGDFPMHCIGPSDSDALLAMENELGQTSAGDLDGIIVYSPSATISDEELSERVRNPPAHPDCLQRTIPSDLATCKLLMRELQRRRIARAKDNDMVAIISEWDTLYGQSLRSTFSKSLPPLPDGAGDRFRAFTYMRGVDGQLPGDKAAQEKPAPPAQAKPEPYANAEAPPAGRSQVDYLERLNRQLCDADQDLRSDGKRGFSAIGIFGSDDYDKLLIIRALRPSFPDALFFTTDMQARFSLASELTYTRNLIVASPFGLCLRDSLQRSAPPFRDCYQSSAFLATLKAIDDPEAKKVCTSQPCIFEIGRDGAYDLEHASSTAPECDPHPPTVWERNVWGWRPVLLVLAVLVIAIVLSTPLVRRLGPFCGFVLATIGPIVAIGALAWFDYDRHGEPFLVLRGISTWPTDTLRAIALSLSLVFILTICGRLRRLMSSLNETYFSEASPDAGGTNAVRAIGLVRGVILPFRPAAPGSVEQLWAEFNLRRASWRRLTRVSLGVTLLILMFMSLFSLLGAPRLPIRDGLSFWTGLIVIFATVVFMLTLLVLVLDVNASCNWLARELLETDPPRTWRRERLAQAAKDRDLSPADLNSWLSIRLVADATAVVSQFTYFPFIVILVFLVARHQVFDAWSWPAPLIIVFVSLFGLLILAAVTLRYSAKRAQSRIVRDLRREAMVLDGVQDKERRRKALLALAAEVEDERRGAFSGMIESPALRGVLIPAAGMAALRLLELVGLATG